LHINLLSSHGFDSGKGSDHRGGLTSLKAADREMSECSEPLGAKQEKKGDTPEIIYLEQTIRAVPA
jgi:hypothetical protein